MVFCTSLYENLAMLTITPQTTPKILKKSTPLGMMGKNRRTDDRRSVKLTWAFSSDELKTKDCVYCFYILKNIALCIKYCKYCFWTLLRNMFCVWGIYQWNWTCLKNLNAFTNQMFKIKLLAMQETYQDTLLWDLVQYMQLNLVFMKKW